MDIFSLKSKPMTWHAQFYQTVFDWTFNKNSGVPIEYLDIETGGARGGLLKRPAKTPPPEHGTNAFVCSVQVENIDEIAGRILSKGEAGGVGKIPRPRQVLAGLLRGYGRQHLRHL